MKRFTNSRKFLFGLAVSMVLAMAIGSFALSETQTQAIPQAVEAQSAVGATAGPFTVNGGTEGVDYSYTSPVLTIHSGNLTISTSGETAERIVVDGAATITLAGVNISTGTGPALQIQDDATFNVNILLADGSNNILKATANYYAGLQKNGEGASIGTLTIGVQDGSTGTGKLEANGGYQGAGIGSGKDKSTSKITITGGVVTATGGSSGAGIGGGDKGSEGGSGSNITISGGVVTVNGGYYAAGIGGGDDGSASNITISGGVVTVNGGYRGASIGSGYYGSGSNITITGGVVTAIGDYGAGIGGGENGSASNIRISGGEVTTTGGYGAAGIGSGTNRDVSDITINGGVVKATGGNQGSGIGGGSYGNGSDIKINGGVVTAIGGNQGAGIGGGNNGRGSGNSLNGDAVVLATSGYTSKAALEGFADSDLNQGITFTRQTTSGTWSGTMYGDSVTISQNVEFPANLTIGTNQSNPQELIVDTNVTLTISAGATLQNEGTLTISGTVDCLDDQTAGITGKVTTKTDFYLEGSTDVYATGYQIFQTSAGVQKYTNLPNPDGSNDTVFDSWFTKPGGPDGGGTKVDENTNVLLNEHSFYEHRVVVEYTITVADLENGSITPNVTEAAKDDTVTLTVIPAEGYQLKEGSLTVTDTDGNEVPVTEQDGKYTFTMPGADVTVSAAFELIPEPSVDPDQGGGSSDASSKTGDSFAGIAALAIFGVATTGAVMLRKRK